MANLRTNNLSGEQGQNAYRGSVYFRGYIDGTAADFLSVPESDDLDMGTGDFTLECYVRAAKAAGQYAGILGMHTYSTNGFVFQIGHTGKLRLVNPNYLGHDDSTVTGSTVIIPQNGTFGDWHHLAVVRSSGTIKGYVNGVEEISFSYSSGVDFANGGAAVIGATSKGTHPGDYDLKGYLSNLRLIKGTALYTTNYFTPPTSELTIVDGTVLLCCQDSDNPTQEATGKTITAHGGMFQSGNKNILSNGDFSQGTQDFIGDSGASISESGGVMTVTNGGGDNTFALRQEGVFIIGGKYRCTATVTPTFASGNPVFRVRFGGSGDSFVQPQSSMSTGVTFRLDTGEKVADGLPFEIGSGSSSGITQFTVTDLVVTAVNPPILPKVIPPYGVDAGNTFGGTIQQNSEGYMYFPTGRTEERGRGRGFVGGGNNPGTTNTIQFVEIRTSGNSLDFGDLTYGRQSTLGAVANTTRAIWGGGQIHPANSDIMDFITISTTGNATDFGNLTVARRNLDGTGNQTRGLFGGGQTPTLQDVIDFVTIATLGNATDFGNLSVARNSPQAASSPTRGLFNGGNAPSGSDVIDFVTIATAGNATDFGNLTVARAHATAVSSKTRAVMMGGNAGAPGYANYNTIDFVTIASAGNATDFGDLITAISNSQPASNSIIGLSMGGSNGSINTIEFITIASTGNSSLFGELLSSQGEGAGCSDSHGGLS
tara:strand:- start:26 stop:2158 length:2133 start_codon:yes stop_codon:yes gene_type:complete